MKLQIRPLDSGDGRAAFPDCRLCVKTADFHASVPGLGEFFVCQACIDKPEKPAGNSFMQRYLAVEGGGSFFGPRERENLVQAVVA